MGYSTDFMGEFNLDKELDDVTYGILDGLSKTRRMKRDIKKLAKRLNISVTEAIKKYGKEGEFYFDLKNMGQDKTDDIVDFNTPPKSQAGLWCQWEPSSERLSIRWDGKEKFYQYEEWLTYIIEKILKPRGYVLNGKVTWAGEDYEDRGQLYVIDNVLTIKYGVTYYLQEHEIKIVDKIVKNYQENSLKELVDEALHD